MPILCQFDPISYIVTCLIIAAISAGVGILLRPKIKSGQKPAGVSDFTLPMAEEGRPVPVLFGCRYVQSANSISPILRLITDRKGSKDAPKTYYYYVTMLMGVCVGPIDGIKQVRVQDKYVWPTPDNPDSVAGDGETLLSIYHPNCFGGWQHEGGIYGWVGVNYGAADQALDPWLATFYPNGYPAYRGLVTVIWKGTFGVYIGTSPYLKPWYYLCKRTLILNDGSPMWYVEKAVVNTYDLNAIHILYELLTSPMIGRGKSTLLIGASFATAAASCFTDGYGLSCVWDRSSDDVETMVDQILQIIDGVLYEDPSTGKYEIGLARNDYDELDEFDESDFWVGSFKRPSVGQLPSETIVQWHDRLNMKDLQVRDGDASLMGRQGGVPIVQTLDYRGWICDPALANKVAARVQYTVSAMPAQLTIHGNRKFADKYPNSVFKISYPALGIDGMIVRVVRINYGTLQSGEVVLDLVEDRFGMGCVAEGNAPGTVNTPTSPSEQDRRDEVLTVSATAGCSMIETPPE